MLHWLKSWRERRRSERAALSAAIEAFQQESSERPSSALSSVVAEDDTQFIVQVCFGRTRPPGRAWFSVARADLSARALTQEQVGEFYDVPMWR